MEKKVIAISEFSGEQTIFFNNIKEAAHYFRMTPTGIKKAIEKKKGNLSYKAGSYFDYLYEGAN